MAMFSGYSFPVHLIAANMQEERVEYAKRRCKPWANALVATIFGTRKAAISLPNATGGTGISR